MENNYEKPYKLKSERTMFLSKLTIDMASRLWSMIATSCNKNIFKLRHFVLCFTPVTLICNIDSL